MRLLKVSLSDQKMTQDQILPLNCSSISIEVILSQPYCEFALSASKLVNS